VAFLCVAHGGVVVGGRERDGVGGVVESSIRHRSLEEVGWTRAIICRRICFTAAVAMLMMLMDLNPTTSITEDIVVRLLCETEAVGA
jgi:hypothetical protein